MYMKHFKNCTLKLCATPFKDSKIYIGRNSLKIKLYSLLIFKHKLGIMEGEYHSHWILSPLIK